MRVSKLLVWQEAYDFALLVYKVTGSFPHDEKYALTSQIRRTALSISANIAGGKGRSTDKDFIRFLYIARGSLEECKVYIMFAKDLGYIDKECSEALESRVDKIGRMLNGLIIAKLGNLGLKEDEVEYE